MKVFTYGQVRLFASLLALFLFYSFEGFSENAREPDTSEPPIARESSPAESETTAAQLQLAVKTMGAAFDASLTSMETVDFILTPALQTQEALSGCSALQNKTEKPIVRFDAEILQEAAVLGHSRALLFARYWVSADSYWILISWSEPNARSLVYPIYPPGIAISSDSQTFKILDYLDSRKNTNYNKPIPPRDIFRHMYGTYPVEEIRFAESEVWATNQASTELTFSAEKTNRLSRKTIYKKEQPITVGFHGAGIKITGGQKTNQFRELPMVREKGGRTCVVEYQPKSLNLTGNFEILPVSIEVRNSKTGLLLRSAKLAGFKRVDSDEEFASIVNQQKPSSIVISLQDHQRLVNKAWDMRIDKLESGDLVRLKELRDFFEKISDKCSSGERLQKYCVLVDLNRMLSDEPRLKSSYIAYLNALNSLGRPDFVLAGGYDIMNGSVLWGRPSEANDLAEIWLKTVNQIEDKKYLERFAAECLRKRDFWMAARLLGNDLPKSEKTFEIAALKYLALNGTSNFLANAGSNTNRNATNETIWVKDSIGTNDLNDLLQKASRDALDKYSKIEEPSEAEKNLLKRVNGIAQPSKGKNNSTEPSSDPD